MVLSTVLDFVEIILPITGNVALDLLIFFLIGFVSFKAALTIGGTIEKDSFLMSVIHWSVRIGGTIVLWALIVGIFRLVKFLVSISMWGWIIIPVLVSLVVAGVVLFIVLYKKRESAKQKVEEQGQ